MPVTQVQDTQKDDAYAADRVVDIFLNYEPFWNFLSRDRTYDA